MFRNDYWLSRCSGFSYSDLHSPHIYFLKAYDIQKIIILCPQSTHIQGGRRRPPSQRYPDTKPTSITQNLRTFYFVFSAFCLVEGVFKERPASSVKYFSSHTLSLPGREKQSAVWETQSSVCCVSPRPTDQTDWATLSYWELLWVGAGAIGMTSERLQKLAKLFECYGKEFIAF